MGFYMQVFMWTYVFISLGNEGVELLSHIVYVQPFEGLPVCFPKWLDLFYNPISNLGGFKFLHLLANTC